MAKDLLFPVRFAVKGWAFTSDDRIPAKLAYAEKLRDELPAELRVRADDHIEPLRAYAEYLAAKIVG